METDLLKYVRRILGTPDKNLNLKTSVGIKEMIELLDFIVENKLDLESKSMTVDINDNRYDIIFSYHTSSNSDFTSSDESWFVSIKIIGQNKSIVFKEYKNKKECYNPKSFDFSNIDKKYTIIEPIDNYGQVYTMINQCGTIYDKYYHPNFNELIQNYSYIGQGLHISDNYWSEENGIKVRKKDDGTIEIEDHSSSLGTLNEYSKKPGDKYITIIKDGERYYYDIESQKLLNEKKSEELNIPIRDYNTDHPEYTPYIKKDSNFCKIISLFSRFDKEVKLTNFNDDELSAIKEQIKNNLVKSKEKAKCYKKI